VGEWDVEVTFLELYHWEPEKVWEQDPEFIVQAMAKIKANEKHRQQQQKPKPDAANVGARAKNKGRAGHR
jgi:hypothetical protein